MFEDYLERWALTPAGQAIVTSGSRLLPVMHDGHGAMLKIADSAEEQAGAKLMVWWNGEGAARVLQHDGHALLLEYATGKESLAQWSRRNRDDRASATICETLARLHTPRDNPPEGLLGLDIWFRDLIAPAEAHEGILAYCADTARSLLDSAQDIVVLHGDAHHGNILDFGARGWLAIDPKFLKGERTFDYANLFPNPDAEVALAPGRLAHQARLVAEFAELDHERLLRWIVAWAGLSAVWYQQDGMVPRTPLAVARLAALELNDSP